MYFDSDAERVRNQTTEAFLIQQDFESKA